MATSVVLGVDAPDRVSSAEGAAPIGRIVGQILFWLAIAAALVFFLFPIFWMVETSFKTINQANDTSPSLFQFTT